MADTVKPILIAAIDLAVQVVEASNEATAFEKEWYVVKIKAQKLLELLETALTASSNLCEFPTRHVISIAEAVLHKSLAVLDECTPKLRNRVLTIIRVSTYQKMLVRLERSINDVSWLLNVSTPSHDGEQEQLFGHPPFAIKDPTLFLIYELMAILYTGTLDDDSCEAARSLRSMASDNPRCAEIMIRNGICSVFVKILKQGSMRVQAEVACATSVLVASFPESQDLFAQHDVIQLLLSRLTSKLEKEDSWHMKAMAAKALRELAKGNSSICKSITDSKRFLTFTGLLEIQDKEVRLNSLMVLVEITSVAEQDSGLRRDSAFKCKSPVFKAIVNQIHKLIEENGDTVLLIPYITLIGNLARSFRASDISMIEQLVKLLGHRDPEVAREAIVALTKFASPCNFLHIDHSRAIVEAGAARQLIELSSLGCEIRIPALELLICIAVHVPEKEQVMKVLQCASKQPLSKS
ncbi:armadillo repeat only 2 [Raphanus sativus]|nr:armadillo repeat only 2 [Raphanus sativus]